MSRLKPSVLTAGLAGALLAGPLGLWAGSRPGDRPAPASPTVSHAPGHAPGAAPISLAARNERSPRFDTSLDQVFAVKAADGNASEIAVSQLALTRAANPAVRQFAQRMITDHINAQGVLSQIAGTRGYPLPPGPGAIHSAVATVLTGLSGAEFDRMYMAVQMEDHENTVALYLTELQYGNDPALRNFTRQTLPVLMEHARAAIALAKSVGAPGANLRPSNLSISPGRGPWTSGNGNANGWGV